LATLSVLGFELVNGHLGVLVTFIYLEQASLDINLDTYSKEGGLFSARQVMCSYPGTMAYFKNKSLPQTLIVVTYFLSYI
jgi:hypothetical protein